MSPSMVLQFVLLMNQRSLLVRLSHSQQDAEEIVAAGTIVEFRKSINGSRALGKPRIAWTRFGTRNLALQS